MKKLFSTLALMFVVSSTYAGTPIIGKNEALGFDLIQYPQGDIEMEICSGSKCLSFNSISTVNSSTVKYKEVTGKCTLTVETFDKDFGSGNTKDEFMLTLMAFVVKVTKGSKNCQLTQKLPNQQRSLTGIYL